MTKVSWNGLESTGKYKKLASDYSLMNPPEGDHKVTPSFDDEQWWIGQLIDTRNTFFIDVHVDLFSVHVKDPLKGKTQLVLSKIQGN